MIQSLIRTPEYQDWLWKLTLALRSGLEESYAGNLDEVECIRSLVKHIGKAGKIESSQTPRSNISVDAAFLHGSRSKVKFAVGGKEFERELADILVLSSFVERGKLKWQRVCLIQTKKASTERGRAASRFDVDEWQLALLRTFPRFSGVSGIFKGSTYHLRNQSGMLGAYGLLMAPGDLSVVSSRVIYGALGGRKSLTGKELLPAILSEQSSRRLTEPMEPCVPWWPFDLEHCPECRYLVEHWWGLPWQDWFRHHHHHAHSHVSHGVTRSNELPLSRLTSLTLEEFLGSWTALQLGEPWFPDSKTQSDLALQRLVSSLVSRISSETRSLQYLQTILNSAAQESESLHTWGQNVIDDSDKGALIVLSVIGSAGQEG